MSGIWAVVVLLLVLAAMIPACIGDWRRREADDMSWWAIGVIGLVSTVPQALDDGVTWEYLMLLCGSAVILFDILAERDWPQWTDYLLYAAIVVLFGLPIALSHDVYVVRCFAVVFISYVLFLVLFKVGVVRGGADTKCLIVLSMAFMEYPVFGPFPLIGVPDGAMVMIFSFPVAVLFHAALFTVVISVHNAARNIRARDRPKLSRYMMDISDARLSHVWPAEDIVDGERRSIPASDGTDAYDRLEAAGIERIWVTPIIPFLIPIAFAVAFVSIVGNILFLAF